MRRIASFFTACMLVLCMLAGCATDGTYQNGVYTAEFKEYDTYGYKEFMRVTVENGLVTELVYNGVNEEGGLKTEDADYQSRMSLVNETYPRRYTADLVNQYLDSQDIDAVTTVAGATWSSDSFVALFKALEENMYAGDTTVVLVDNVLPR